jgi:hypothetical protein
MTKHGQPADAGSTLGVQLLKRTGLSLMRSGWKGRGWVIVIEK